MPLRVEKGLYVPLGAQVDILGLDYPVATVIKDWARALNKARAAGENDLPAPSAPYLGFAAPSGRRRPQGHRMYRSPVRPFGE